MLQKYFKKIILLLFIIITTTLASYALAAITAWLKVDGVWRYGTLFSQGTITITNEEITADPPWSFIGRDDNFSTGSFNEIGRFPFGGSQPGNNINVTVSFSDIEGVKIEPKENISIEIYDLFTGKRFYSTNTEQSINLNKEMFNKSNTAYLLQIINNKGEVITTKFMIKNNEVLIGTPNDVKH